MARQLGGVFLDEIGAQQIAAFAQSCLPEFVAIEPIAESGVLCGNLDRDQSAEDTDNAWSDFALVARDLLGKRPLDSIPLARRIASATVEAFEQR
jgi:hypothetical protein